MSDARLRELERRAWASRLPEDWTAWAGRVRAGVLVDQPELDPSWAHDWWVTTALETTALGSRARRDLVNADPRPWHGRLYPRLLSFEVDQALHLAASGPAHEVIFVGHNFHVTP